MVQSRILTREINFVQQVRASVLLPLGCDIQAACEAIFIVEKLMNHTYLAAMRCSRRRRR